MTTNNIFAQNYSTDEYAHRTLLASLIPSNKGEEGWIELIEETGPADNQIQTFNYLENQGNLQKLVVETPFEEAEINQVEVSSDASLVLIRPEDTDTNNTADRSEPITYIVQPGDVIGQIAQKFNVTSNTILWENDLTWKSVIRPGQKLSILANSGVNHEVKSGDTVSAIAKKYQTDANKIISANKLADASDINVGDLLFIPNGVQPTRVVSSYIHPSAPEIAKNITTGTKFLWPVLSTRITQGFNWRHTGVDIADKMGQPIYASEAGKVERAGWSRGYGYNVIINHGNGIKTLYAHSSKLLVKVGDNVARGETIALIGSTGWSTGPHVHYEIRINNTKQNPFNYIK